MTHVLNRIAVERPDEVALQDGRVRLGWAAVNDLLNRATNALMSMVPGDTPRLAVFAENSAETLLIHLAALLAGVSSVPVNFHLTAEEVAYILSDSRAQALFLGPETEAIGLEAARLAGLPTIIGWRLGPSGSVRDWQEWLAEAHPGEAPSDRVPRPNLLYTSGTTGRPKGSDLPPTMFAGGSTVAEHLDNLAGNPFARFGVHLVVGPMYHTGPLSGFRLLAVGVPVVILGRFDAHATLDAIERYRVESSVMVPTHFIRLLQLSEAARRRYNTTSLKLVVHTGAACPIEIKRAMIEWWGPVFIEAYGATEVGTTCQITSEEWLAHPGSVGRAVPPFSALVIDQDGRQLPAQREGQLYFADSTGRGVVYHGDPEKSLAAHLRPGVFTLGEVGFVDGDGYVYITDRVSDMVLSGGVNIYPAESEQVLAEHPEVSDVAVIGIPHAEMGEQLLALVVPVDTSAPPPAEELIAFCRQRLAHYKCPRTVEFVSTVGRTTMGKVNKRALRAPYRTSASETAPG
jgi:acyl-CoA synthetase (AMP-forming)/AMP-acid ligase II